MRKSWKTVADNLAIYLTRAQMQKAYDDQRAMIVEYETRKDTKSQHHLAGHVQTLHYLAKCLANYDEDFPEG